MIDDGKVDASISETIISGEVSSMSGEVLSGSTVMTSSGDLVSNSGGISYATGSLPLVDTEIVGNTSTSWNPENEIIEEFLMP